MTIELKTFNYMQQEKTKTGTLKNDWTLNKLAPFRCETFKYCLESKVSMSAAE